MSTLSKVFAILLVVFSIAFTSMTISFVVRTENWQELAQTYQQHARIADTNLRNSIAANAAEVATLRETINRHLSRNSALEEKLRDQANDTAQLRAELAQAASGKTTSEAINRGLLAQLQSSESARATYQKQRDDLERQNIDLTRRNIDLNDRVNEQTAQVSVMQEQRRQLEQQVNILKSENERIAASHGRSPSAVAVEDSSGLALRDITASTPAARAPIRGRVTEVAGNIVTISVGDADGVKKGMVFVVHRGDQYIGDLKINAVDPERSAGRALGAAFVPQVGDLITDATTMTAGRG